MGLLLLSLSLESSDPFLPLPLVLDERVLPLLPQALLLHLVHRLLLIRRSHPARSAPAGIGRLLGRRLALEPELAELGDGRQPEQGDERRRVVRRPPLGGLEGVDDVVGHRRGNEGGLGSLLGGLDREFGQRGFDRLGDVLEVKRLACEADLIDEEVGEPDVRRNAGNERREGQSVSQGRLLMEEEKKPAPLLDDTMECISFAPDVLQNSDVRLHRRSKRLGAPVLRSLAAKEEGRRREERL